MPAQIQERVVLRNLNDPILITAFASPQKGGGTAKWALSHVVENWNATPVAELDADDCYDYGQIRPRMRIVAGRTEIDWPSNQVYLASPEGSHRSFLLMLGIEPSHKWKEFAEV